MPNSNATNSNVSSKDLDLNALDVLLDALAQQASDASTDRASFYSAINRQIAASTESLASAVFVKNTKGQSRIVQQYGWDRLPASVSESLNNASKKIIQEISPDQTKSVADSSNAAGHKLVFAHCKPLSGMQFVFLLVRNTKDNELANQVYRDLTLEIANYIEIFENGKSASKSPRTVVELTQIAQLVQNLGKSNGSGEMAFHLVNDLAKITHADRVTYFSPSAKIKAISGVSNVSQQTSVVKSLTKIARLTLKSGAIEWQGEKIEIDGNRKPRGLEALIKSVPAKSGFSIPVQQQASNAGILLFEFFELPESAELDRRELVNESIEFVTPVVERNLRTFSIPGIGLLDWLFNRIVVRSVRSGLALCLVLGLIAIAGYWMFGMQSPFEIYGEGTLQTAEQNHIFSHVDGEVERLLVREGSHVKPGEHLLQIRSKDLEKEIVSVRGRIEEAQTEQRALRLADLSIASENSGRDESQRASDLERLKIRLETLASQLQLLEEKEKQLVIRTPIVGSITTQNLKQKLFDRPIDRGDLLMTVSNTDGQWQVELAIPDNRVEFIKSAMTAAKLVDESAELEVIFRLASDSNQTYTGKLTHIDYRSDQRSTAEETQVIAYASIDEQELGDSLRLGSRVYGKVACGQRNNFFLLTYEARNRINQWFFR